MPSIGTKLLPSRIINLLQKIELDQIIYQNYKKKGLYVKLDLRKCRVHSLPNVALILWKMVASENISLHSSWCELNV